MAPNRVIIDTDPGIDDVLALLLAFSSSPKEIEVLLLSITFGNINVQNCLRNVVSMFHVIQKELEWRKRQGYREGFETLKNFKPIVAVGAEEPLGDPREMAAHIHGNDGLGGVHTSHPHHSCPEETWKHLFDRPPSDTLLTSTAVGATLTDPTSPISLFTPSNQESYLEILRLLDENPPNTITIIAVGPLTNLALAASHSPATFLRAKSVLIMGGAIHRPGNATPVAEFNTMADPTAAARIFALTSPNPSSTMPPPTSHSATSLNLTLLPAYPETPDSPPLNLILFPLDITTSHTLLRGMLDTKTQSDALEHSPLAEWVIAFLTPTFIAMETLHHGTAALSLHDPLCIWYALTATTSPHQWDITEGEDIRVETAGQWTRGMCVIDRRNRKRGQGKVVGDMGGWLNEASGNRVRRCVSTPGEDKLGIFLLKSVFGDL